MALKEEAPWAARGDEGVSSLGAATPAWSDMPVVGAAQLAVFSDVAAWSRLSAADSTEVFAAAWLELQCRLIGGVQAAVVVLGPNDDGAFEPLAYWPEGSGGTPALVAVAELSLAQRRGAVRQRPVTQGGGTEPLDAVSYPLLVGEQLRGAVAIEVLHENDARLHGVMRLLQWGCAWWHQRLGAESAEPGGLTKVLEVLAAALQEDRFVAAATAAATNLATTLQCERVSFGTRAGQHSQVRALSHTANFNKKSALIRALGTAMDEALDQQQTVVVPCDEQAVPLVTRAHQELLDRHGARAVCTIPIGDNARPIGALTLERADDRPFSDEEVRLCEHTSTLLGPVLEARRRDDRWLAAKVWDSLNWLATALFGAGHLPLKLSALVLAGLVLFFSLATGQYRITAPAALEGTVQRAVTAPQDGFIASAAVRAGDLVTAQQPLATLEDKDLRLEKVQAEAEREKYLREYSKSLADRERAEVRILGAQVEQAEARIALLSEQLARIRITAPFAGIVVSGDLSQSLGTPVSRGDVLFEIAPLDSYRVALEVDERDIAALQVGQTGALALAGLPGEPLSVRVAKITPVATAKEGRNLFRVEASLQGSSTALRPGMKGVAKIDVDERRLFWIWTHQLAYWLRLWWWSWWP